MRSTACGSPLQEHLPRTPEKRSRAHVRKIASRQFSSDSNVSSDADLASNVYRSLSLTVSEADDETMASKRGALEVEKLLLSAAVDDKNRASSPRGAARRVSARWLRGSTRSASRKKL